MGKGMVLAAGVLAAAATVVQAGDAPVVTVTANPIVEETRLDNLSATTAIVTESQLRDQNAVDLASALRRTPGVEISRYNPVGSFGGDQGGAVFIRGLGVSRPGSEIKTYVDGVPLYMGVWGHPLLDLLPVNAMQSIAVLKGPQPAQYGNNFAAINLETRRANADGASGSARISAGSYATVIEKADLVGRHGDLDYLVAQGYARSDGHRPNADGQLQNAIARLGYRLTPNWSIGASLLGLDNRAKDPYDERQPTPAVPPRYESSATVASVHVDHRHGDWQGQLRIYDSRGEGNLYDDNRPMVGWGTFFSDFKLSGLRWREELRPWATAVLTAGIDHDSIGGTVEGPMTGGRVDLPTFRLTSPHIAVSQDFALAGDWHVVPSAGIRYYDHSQFDAKSAPHVGLSLVSDRVTLFGSLARGVSYPGLELPALQAAIPFMFAGRTWPQLSAEELDHAELGAKLNPLPGTQFDLSLFRDKIRNRYVYDLTFASTTFYETGGYRTNGVEIAVRQQIGRDWLLFAGATLLDPGIDNLPYTPERAVTFGLNGSLGPVRLALDAQYQSEVFALNRDRNTLNPNTEKVGGFAVANLRLSYPLPLLGSKGEVFVAVENLFDREYGYRPGYPMPGRWGQVGISAGF